MTQLLDELQDKVVDTLQKNIADNEHKNQMTWIPAVKKLNLFIVAYHGLNVVMECQDTR